MRMALFISLVIFVLKCKHCSYSYYNESSIKNIYPFGNENKKTETPMSKNYIHTFKHIMANTSQNGEGSETPHCSM